MRTTSVDKATTKAGKPTGALSRGRVERVFPDRGFGFIKCLEGPAGDIGDAFFFHATSLDGLTLAELEEGETVTFTPTYVAKGKRAAHIVREGA